MSINKKVFIAFLFIVGLVLASVMYKAFIVILCVLLLIINRDIVSRIIRHLRKTYQRNLLFAIGLTLLYILGFTPFMVFLFFRTALNAVSIKKELQNSEPSASKGHQIKLDQLLKIKNKMDS